MRQAGRPALAFPGRVIGKQGRVALNGRRTRSPAFKSRRRMQKDNRKE